MTDSLVIGGVIELLGGGVASTHPQCAGAYFRLGTSYDLGAPQITSEQVASWASGTPEDWAWEAFAVAQEDAYGDPPLSTAGPQHVDAGYVERAQNDVALQLSRAGVRLAYVLNRAMQ